MIILALAITQTGWKRVDLDGILLDLPVPAKRVFPQGAPPSVRNWVMTSGNEGVGISLQPSDPARPADINLADDLASFMSGYKGRIVAQSDVVLNGWTGLDVSLNLQELGDIRFVAFQTDRGLLTVTAGGNGPGSVAFGNRVVESLRLADSFDRGLRKTRGPDWTRTPLKPSPFSAEFPRTPDGGKPMAAPSSPFQPRTWLAQYGNRRYVATIVTPLEKSQTSSTMESRWKSIQNIGDGTLKSAKAKPVSRKRSIFLGEPSERVEGESIDGATTILSEVTVKDEETIVAVAIVPTALRSSPEVVRFFRSFTTIEKAGG